MFVAVVDGQQLDRAHLEAVPRQHGLGEHVDEHQAELTRALAALKKGGSLTLAGVPEGFDALVVGDLARGLTGAIEGPAVP